MKVLAQIIYYSQNLKVSHDPKHLTSSFTTVLINMSGADLQPPVTGDDVWTENATLIRQLYISERKTLKKVKETLESQHGFPTFPCVCVSSFRLLNLSTDSYVGYQLMRQSSGTSSGCGRSSRKLTGPPSTNMFGIEAAKKLESTSMVREFLGRKLGRKFVDRVIDQPAIVRQNPLTTIK